MRNKNTLTTFAIAATLAATQQVCAEPAVGVEDMPDPNTVRHGCKFVPMAPVEIDEKNLSEKQRDVLGVFRKSLNVSEVKVLEMSLLVAEIYHDEEGFAPMFSRLPVFGRRT